jgi:hypothetical protein
MLLKNFRNFKKLKDLKKLARIKKNNFLIIILLVLNIIFWNYYIIYYTTIYKNLFYDFNNGNPVSENIQYLYLNFLSDENNKLVILETPNNKIFLIDTGGDEAATKVLNYMRSKNIAFIDTIFLTTANDNANRGLAKILNTFSVGEIIDGTLTDNARVRYIISKHPEISYSTAKMDRNIYLYPDLEFKFYYATDENNRNFGSLFLHIQYKNKSILLTANNTEKAQTGLLKTWETRKEHYQNIDILEYPYTGYDSNISLKFLDALKPRYVIVSNRSLFNNDLLDMNIWDNFSSKQKVKYVKTGLVIKTDGDNIKYLGITGG